MPSKPDLQPKFIRSFGRIVSRKLSGHKKDLLENSLLKYQITAPEINISRKNDQKIYLEIGFGFGDFLFENAKRNPEILFIGCEPHINGTVNLLAKLEVEPLNNIKILLSDSRLLLEQLNDKILDKIYILFPDPWPKSKHYKRRLINVDFLKLVHNKAKESAELIIATDDNNYKKWIMAEYFRSELWNWLANSKENWQQFPDDWVKTKYQKKAEIAGRENIYLALRKKS